jgi:hypothetical protein
VKQFLKFRTRARACLSFFAYCLFVLGLTCSGFCAEEGQIIFAEDFDSYADTAAMQRVWGESGLGTLELGANGTGKAAFHPGGKVNVVRDLAIEPTDTMDVVFTFDLYDFATNGNKRVTAGLRNTTNAILEMGCYNAGGGAYLARAVGFAGGAGWRSFDPTQTTTRGWHRFRAVISRTNTVFALDLGANGSVDRVIEIPTPPQMVKFTEIRFGGPSDVTSLGGGALFDNIRLEMVPTGTANSPAVLAKAPAPTFVPPVPLNAVPRPATNEISKAATNEASRAVVTNAAAKAEPKIIPEAPVRSEQVLIGWVAGGIGVVILLLATLLVLFLKRTGRPAQPASTAQERSMLPAALSPVSYPPHQVLPEHVPANPEDGPKTRLGQELEEFAKQSLVQGLYQQRKELIETQARARQELATLEARLAELQAPLRERIQAYEKRISELEHELESRGAEMRELVSATLLLVRQKLEEERAKEGPRFN